MRNERDTDVLGILLDWAVCAPLETVNPVIGHAQARLLLVQLARHANVAGTAFPSAGKLAEDLGIARRTARAGLELLTMDGLIERAGLQGRSIRWRLRCPELEQLHAEVLSQKADNVAGEVAGEVAGDMAGYPATNRTERKNPPHPPADRPAPAPAPERREEEIHPKQEQAEPVASELAPAPGISDMETARVRIVKGLNLGIDDGTALALARRAADDGKTKYTVEGRLGSPAAVSALLEAHRADVKTERQRQLARSPRCEDHGDFPAKACPPCVADVKVGDRLPEFVGKRQPSATAGEPVSGLELFRATRDRLRAERKPARGSSARPPAAQETEAGSLPAESATEPGESHDVEKPKRTRLARRIA